MAELPVREKLITHALLDFLGFGEPALSGPRPEGSPFCAHFEDAPFARLQRDLANLGAEGRQQFLGEPCRPEQPPALGAILYLDTR
jgi:hypothetical protein